MGARRSGFHHQWGVILRGVAAAFLIASVAHSDGRRPLRGAYLEPEPGPFLLVGFNAYRIALDGILFRGQPSYRPVEMVVLSPSNAEEAVFVTWREVGRNCQTDAQVIAVTMAESLESLSQRNPVASKNRTAPIAEVLNHYMALPSAVRVSSAPIDCASAMKVQDLWETMLSSVRYEDERAIVVGGTEYHFVSTAACCRVKSGMAIDPTPGSLVAEFVAVGTTLFEYARTTIDGREDVKPRLLHRTATLKRAVQNFRRSGQAQGV